MEYLWILVAFICGALPLSFWLGKLVLRVDIREYGDGNPGAANVYRAGGKVWGLTAILLDSFKGLIPVAIANFGLHVEGWQLAAIALAPIFGHAYSPFLGFKGGKALAVSFGIWTGLTLWVVPPVLGLFSALGLMLVRPEGWSVLVAMLSLGIFIVLVRPDPVWIAVWLGNTLLLVWTHRQDITQRPHLKQPWKRGNKDGAA